MFRHTDVYAMSANQLETVPGLGITGNSPQPVLAGTVGVDRPASPSGSPTYPLDVMAAVSPDGRRLTVSVINPSERAQQLVMELQKPAGAAGYARNGRRWTIAPADINARNIPGQEQQIKLVKAEVPDLGAPQSIAPVSISVYEFVIR